MSFEGHQQVLCTRGHLSVFDAYDEQPDHCQAILNDGNKNEIPKVCNEDFAEFNMVDETNGCEGEPCICGAKELVVIEPAVLKTCDLGHQHEMSPARYKFGEVKRHVDRRGFPLHWNGEDRT